MTLVGQVLNEVVSAMLALYVANPDEEAKPRPFRVEFKHYSGKEREYLTLWIRKDEMTMIYGLISLDHQRALLAILNIDGRAR